MDSNSAKSFATFRVIRGLFEPISPTMKFPLSFLRRNVRRMIWVLALAATASVAFAYEGRLLPDDVIVSREKGRESAAMNLSLLVRPGAGDALAYSPPEKLHVRVTSGEII